MHLGKPLCSLLFCLYPKRNWSGGRGREEGRDRGKAGDETGRDWRGKVNLRDQRQTDNGNFCILLSPTKNLWTNLLQLPDFPYASRERGLPEIYSAACMPDRPFLLGLPIFCVSAAHMTARRQIYREGGLHPVSISPAFLLLL